jgi:hypothetical protein
MSIQSAWQATFSFFENPVVVEPSQGQITGDAGLLPLRELDERLGWTRQFAAAISDGRCQGMIGHGILEMARSRIYGIVADYEDQNDHDTLRFDPLFKLIAGRGPEDPALASQPTLSRFENSVDIPSLKRLRNVLIDQFIASFKTPPSRLIFDLDAVDDPAHGQQQLVLFHGYFEQYQYFPSFITSAETDHVVVASLRPGSMHAALGADDDLEYLVRRLRQAWPTVHILVRGDAGYGMPWMYDVCDRLSLEYTFGLAANSVLKNRSDALLEQAVTAFAETGTPQRLFDAFWYQAGTWNTARWVIVKAECQAQGTNRRFIITNRPGAAVLPEAVYDDYAMRGEAENRNKELKCGLQMDRTSDHRFMANFFRLYLHVEAHNLLACLRRLVVMEAPPFSNEMPNEALTGRDRQRHFSRRRRRDPLGEGQPCTWRTLLIKVAAEVLVRSRRVIIRLAANWPHHGWYRHICQQLGALSSPSSSTS